MIAPRRVRFEAKKKENENLEFRTFLKCHADEKELDKQFKRLHDELFSTYDCSRCRNCCKMYHGSIPSEDLERDAEILDLTKEQFVERYLIKNEVEDTYETRTEMDIDVLGVFDGNLIQNESNSFYKRIVENEQRILKLISEEGDIVIESYTQ